MFASLAIANPENLFNQSAVKHWLILPSTSVQHSMKDNQYSLDIDEGRLPHNAHMVFSIATLELIMPIFLNEILVGLVNTQGDDLVSLHLFLSKPRIQELQTVLAESAFEEVHSPK